MALRLRQFAPSAARLAAVPSVHSAAALRTAAPGASVSAAVSAAVSAVAPSLPLAGFGAGFGPVRRLASSAQHVAGGAPSTGAADGAAARGGKRRLPYDTRMVPVSGSLNGVEWFNSACPKRSDYFCGMELTLLGTGASYPSRFRNVTCSALRLATQGTPTYTWLFDCGEGSQRQASKSLLMPSLSAVDRVFISHLHGDHVFGLLGLIASRAAWFLSHAQTTLHVYGPPGIAAFLASAVGISVPTRVVVHELLTPADKPTASSGRGAPQRHHLYVPQHQGGSRQKDGITVNPVYPDPDGKWTVYADDHYEVTAAPIDHTVRCFGYAVQEAEMPGTFNVDAATALGLYPGKEYAELKSGKTVVTSSGTVIQPSDVLGPPTPGRKVVILGDTCNPWNMESLAQGADLLVHEATMCGDKDDASAIRVGHSTPRMAGEFAAAVGAKRLVMNHFSNTDCGRYPEASIDALPSTDRIFPNQRRMVRRHEFPVTRDTSGMAQVVETAQKASGMEAVVAGRDFMVFPIPRKLPVADSEDTSAVPPATPE